MERKALKACAEWLVLCLKLGWPKSDLDRLEALWWEYHSEGGQLKPPSGDPSELRGENDNGQPKDHR